MRGGAHPQPTVYCCPAPRPRSIATRRAASTPDATALDRDAGERAGAGWAIEAGRGPCDATGGPCDDTGGRLPRPAPSAPRAVAVMVRAPPAWIPLAPPRPPALPACVAPLATATPLLCVGTPPLLLARPPPLAGLLATTPLLCVGTPPTPECTPPLLLLRRLAAAAAFAVPLDTRSLAPDRASRDA